MTVPARASLVQPSAGVLRPLAHDAVRLAGGFWGERQDRNRAATIPHVHQWMSRLGWIENFANAARGGTATGRRGREFTDTNVHNLLEALQWDVARAPHVNGLDLATLIETIASAQEADGYINTYFQAHPEIPRYSDLAWGHELFCYGHLIQAGIAEHRTTGEGALFDVARRAADHVVSTFRDGANEGYCGHPGIEMALVELFRATGDDAYLAQAQAFIERRGRGLFTEDAGSAYFQDDVPVRDATVLRGHAVRALYLAAGAVDVAVERDDRDLLDAVITQFDATLARRTYITGGMGSRHQDEAFGEDYELPADRAYCETCAGIASVMLSWRLLLATGDAKYADVIERTLFNVVAGSTDWNGTAFFYANTLHQRSEFSAPLADGEPNARAASSTRSPWFTVACCPTNLARTLAALQMYVATSDASGLQIHQYTPCRIDDGTYLLEIETDYPREGVVIIRVLRAPPTSSELSLRFPAWAHNATIEIAGETRHADAGYVRIRRSWNVGDVINLMLPMDARWTSPDPRIDGTRAAVALERGPRVYCLESHSDELDIEDVAVDPMEAATAVGLDDKTTGIDTVESDASIVRTETAAWPYGESVARTPGKAVRLKLVPYHDRANRGPSTMRVFLPIVDKTLTP